MPSDTDKFTLGEIQLFAGNYTPEDWQPCTGQTLRVGDNYDLFRVIGNRYGGDGQTNFQLPNLPTVATAVAGQPPLHYYICVKGQTPYGTGLD